ncbi:MAG: TonB-dependent receptor [Pseudomonadales bacterium]
MTAERRESTLSDTSISITAFTDTMIEDFGLRNQEDLQNYIPAAVIEPYDMAIRGVGRNFRSLGGDPGVATYQNGVYSEDFGIASTEGGLFDVRRIEVLRGPQGTLYGRNAIGGAVNFINNLPTEAFEGEARVVVGNYDLVETYGVLSGPVLDDWLQARLTGVKRERDGYYDDKGPARDAGNYGDENYALSLRFAPTDGFELNVRANERSYRRRMGGANNGGIVVFDENGNEFRDTTTLGLGFRAVDPAAACPSAFLRTPIVAVDPTLKRGEIGCAVPGLPLFTFTNPETGGDVIAQRRIPGIDRSDVGINRAFGLTDDQVAVIGFDDIRGDDLETATNGFQDEFFDHQAVSLNADWRVGDTLAVRYLFGYTDYFYDRTTDTDLTNSQLFDTQAYLSQETEYASHELQVFLDPTERLSVTSGLFAYDARITQRGDNFDGICQRDPACNSKTANDFAIPYAALGPGLAFLDVTPPVDLSYARRAGVAQKSGAALPFNCAPLNTIPVYCSGPWRGDTGDRIPHGPATVGTGREYQTRTEREAYAAFSQATYEFNDAWALTLGVRWARDELAGYETVFYYTEDDFIAFDFDPVNGGFSPLMFINMGLGYMSPTGEVLDPQRLITAGVPSGVSLWRELDRVDEKITWRANVDWTPTDSHLVYLSATRGYRAGGFNLGFFSSDAQYEPETLISYELGYKGTLLASTLQLNAAVYLYDYEDIHTFGQSPSLIDPDETTTSVFAVPKAEIRGFDADLMWLATATLTLGGNISYTRARYDSDFLMINGFGPESPDSLFNATGRLQNLNGNRMPRIPEFKGGAWAQYTWPLGDAGNLEAFISWSWIDQVYFSEFEEDTDSAPAYDRWDARATWRSANRAWSVAAFVNNLRDEIGIRQVTRGGEGSNYLRTGATTDPRLYGLELRYRFGAFEL